VAAPVPDGERPGRIEVKRVLGDGGLGNSPAPQYIACAQGLRVLTHPLAYGRTVAISADHQIDLQSTAFAVDHQRAIRGRRET
jgi:hypothetical protein